MYIFHGAFSEFGMQLLCLLTRQGCMEQPILTAKRFHTALCLALLSSSGGVLKVCPFLDELKEQDRKDWGTHGIFWDFLRFSLL